MKYQTLLFVFLVYALLMSACASAAAATSPTEGASPQPVAVEDQASLVTALEAAGAAVEAGESITQAFFSPEGNIIKVNGADVQVFEYESTEAMESESSQVAPDGGSVGTSMMMWVDTPHFYKAGRIIALYVGSDTTILGLLEQILGPQFAGR
jgi:hypothetical protein